MVATDLAAKRGVLFKQAVSLEQASKIQAIIFDKTGTLTEGKPRVTDVVAAGSARTSFCAWPAPPRHGVVTPWPKPCSTSSSGAA